MAKNNTTIVSSDNGHSQCLFCGDLNPRSMNLSFQAEGIGTVKTKFQAGAELQGYDGIIHGGVIAALLDAAMTHCLFHQGIQAITGDLHVRFVRPVAYTASLEIRAWLQLSHPPLHQLRAEITVDNSVMAWAEAKFVQRRVL